ncbi:MAG: hypothetical protein D6830_07180 [Ignavibacteria bacterium]|nr:MAG: hypothetical protein D6830_07180 [Ignavibacteria bacterium]
MSFYPQPDRYRCGPFALKYALVMLGVFKSERDISITAGSTWWAGTDEIGLAKAARRYKCKLKYFHSDNRDDARKLLNKELKKNLPVILSVNNWEHWCTVVNFTKGKYIVIDSELDKVISVESPKTLLGRWKYTDPDTKKKSYDGYSVVPKFKVQTKAKFTLEKAHALMLDTNEGLAKKWDAYFNDLIAICKPRNKKMINYITFNDFLRRNENTIIRKVADWHGEPTYAELKKITQNMKFVANVYDLVIPLDEEKKALIDITTLLTIYVCGKYGMDPIY